MSSGRADPKAGYTLVLLAGLLGLATRPAQAEDLAPPATGTGTVSEAARPSLPERIEALTRGFLRLPYVVSPLGEGRGIKPDQDPRFRLDAFDCTTFVETAMALAAGDAEDAPARLDQIRYDGEPSFEHRRHFVVGQWREGLTAGGWVEDATEAIGGEETRWVTLTLDAARWKHRHIALTLRLPPERIPNGVFRVPFVPIAVLAADPERIPPGTIINVVRQDVPWSPVLVTHQGLILSVPGKPGRIVRHASPVAHRVIDEPLVRMLARYAKPRPWPVIGLNFLRIVDRRTR